MADTGSMNRTLHQILLGYEQHLLTPEVRRNRSAIERLLAEEFLETGKSGTQYRRADILEQLAKETPRPTASIQDFRAVLLGPEAALATYTAVVDGDRSHRASVWIYRESRWQMLHHQGTTAS